jgi:hypothetical protein
VPVTAGGSGATEGVIMAKVDPFHSIAPNDPKVHHNNLSCTEGNNIEPQNKRARA